MKGCGDRGDYKTYCSGIFELFTQKNIIIGYVHVFPFFTLRFFFFSRVVNLTILSQARHGNRAESGYGRQFVRVKNKERKVYYYKLADQFFS